MAPLHITPPDSARPPESNNGVNVLIGQWRTTIPTSGTVASSVPIRQVRFSGTATGPPASTMAVEEEAVRGNRSKPLGFNLRFVAPIVKNGGNTVRLVNDDLKMGEALWENALVGFVMDCDPSFKDMLKFVKGVWSFVAEPRVFKHENGFFIFRFESAEDKDLILQDGPFYYDNKPVILKPWSPKVRFEKEEMRIVPIWVKFPNLPLNCWTEDSLSRLASFVGNPLYSDTLTAKAGRVSFARVLIETDVSKSLPKKIPVEDEAGFLFEQEIAYDWEPRFCIKCAKWGHESDACGLEQNAQPQQHQAPRKRRRIRVNRWVQKEPVQQQQPQNPVAEDEQDEGVRDVIITNVQDSNINASGRRVVMYHGNLAVPQREPVIGREMTMTNAFAALNFEEAEEPDNGAGHSNPQTPP